MLKKFTIIASFIFMFLVAAGAVSADFSVAEESAQLITLNSDQTADSRVITLRNFLEFHNSPLAPYSEVFVENADKYKIDWRLVPAISGVESTFGKRIPKNSYNAYGWANGAYRFKSWEDSIEVVSKALREKYLDKGATTMAKIARRYAASPTWLWRVEYFMDKIEPLPIEFDLEG